MLKICSKIWSLSLNRTATLYQVQSYFTEYATYPSVRLRKECRTATEKQIAATSSHSFFNRKTKDMSFLSANSDSTRNAKE